MMFLDLPDLCNPDFGGSGVGDITSKWVHMQGFLRCHVSVELGADAKAINVSVFQATDAKGSGSRPLIIPSVFSKFAGANNFTRTIVEADTHVITDAGAGIVVLGLDVSRMDINEGYQYLQVKLTGSVARQQGLTIYPTGGKVVRVAPSVLPFTIIRGWTGLENCQLPYLLDLFNDAEGTVIEDHLLDTGQSWQLFGASGVPEVNVATIQGNQLRFDVIDQVIVADPGTNDIKIEVDWTPQLDSRQMLVLRLQTDGEFLSLRVRVESQYDIELIGRNGGSAGTLYASAPYSWVPGQTYAIEVTIVDSLVTVRVDGIQIFRLIITEFNAFTLTGLGAYTNDGLGLFDNYRVSKPPVDGGSVIPGIDFTTGSAIPTFSPGGGTYAFTRNSVGSITDYLGNTIETFVGEIGFDGLRREVVVDDGTDWGTGRGDVRYFDTLPDGVTPIDPPGGVAIRDTAGAPDNLIYPNIQYTPEDGIFVEFEWDGTIQSFNTLFTLGEDSSNYTYVRLDDPNTLWIQGLSNAVPALSGSHPNFVAGKHKVYFGWKDGANIMSVDGVSVIPTVNGAPPVGVTQLHIGHWGGFSHWNDVIYKVEGHPYLSQETANALTA